MNVKLNSTEEPVLNSFDSSSKPKIYGEIYSANYRERIQASARFLKNDPSVEGEKNVIERKNLITGAISSTITNLIVHAVRHSDPSGAIDILTLNPIVTEAFTNLKKVIYLIVQNIDAHHGVVYESNIDDKIELLSIYIENLLEIMNVNKDAPQIKDLDICIKTIHEEFQIF